MKDPKQGALNTFFKAYGGGDSKSPNTHLLGVCSDLVRARALCAGHGWDFKGHVEVVDAVYLDGSWYELGAEIPAVSDFCAEQNITQLAEAAEKSLPDKEMYYIALRDKLLNG